MRDFCKISPQFWLGKTGKALRGDVNAQVVAFYLMTSPHSNMIGIYSLPVMYLAHETGLTFEGASKGLASLCKLGFCTFEGDTETVWVHEMAKYQIGECLAATDKRCKGVQNELAKVASSLIRRGFAEKYTSDFHLVVEGKKCKPLRSPLQAPLKQGEGEGEGEGEENLVERFEKFWVAYPRKVAKEVALKAFEKRNPDAQMLAQMLAAIAVQAKSLEWTKDKGQFIPHPASWLNAGRWTDETTAEKSTTAATPTWVKNAGFSNVWEANNDRCFEHTAHEFRNGKRIEVAA